MAEVAKQGLDQGLALEIDVIILDYVLYMAIQGVLDERRASLEADVPMAPDVSRGDRRVSMVDSYLIIFRHRHPEATVSAAVKFRLELLKFAVLFARRLYRSSSNLTAESLRCLREANMKRADTFLHSLPPTSALPCRDEDSLRQATAWTPLPSEAIEAHRPRRLEACNILPSTAATDDVKSTVSLMDTLTAFMSLNSMALDPIEAWSINPAWMELAAEYMLQAALEQYCLYGAEGVRALQECFAWGYNPSLANVADREVFTVNAMFRDDSEETQRAWEATQKRYLQTIVPNDPTQVNGHLEALNERFPVATFEAKIIDMLSAFLAIHEQPVLVQVESGQAVGGLSAQEIAAMRPC